jgi:hypothetical protein
VSSPNNREALLSRAHEIARQFAEIGSPFDGGDSCGLSRVELRAILSEMQGARAHLNTLAEGDIGLTVAMLGVEIRIMGFLRDSPGILLAFNQMEELATGIDEEGLVLHGALELLSAPKGELAEGLCARVRSVLIERMGSARQRWPEQKLRQLLDAAEYCGVNLSS